MNTDEEKFSKYFSETIYNWFEYYNMSILYVIFSSKYIFGYRASLLYASLINRYIRRKEYFSVW
jgi:hypothetical protein